jgi:putative tryptophan/tyrosine transport system substrate-binding protein
MESLRGSQMRRREFIAGLSGAVAWPVVARAQQPERMRRIDVLWGGPVTRAYSAFERRLDALGWNAQRTARYELRTGSNTEQMGNSAAELLSWSPDVILAWTNLAVDAIKPIAGHVPIVFIAGDPVGSGFVDSLSHPGGTVTGFESFVPSMGGKWLEILKQTAPQITRAMVVMYPETAVHQAFWRSIEEAAPRLGVEVLAGGVHNAAEIEAAMNLFAAKPNGGLIILPHALIGANYQGATRY